MKIKNNYLYTFIRRVSFQDTFLDISFLSIPGQFVLYSHL